MRRLGVFALLGALVFGALALGEARPALAAPALGAGGLKRVVIVTRHGVRSPTDPTELAPFSARPGPQWEVAPGYLTPRGATLIEDEAWWYRSSYVASGLFSASACPAPNDVYVWADVDERTRLTGKAFLDGFAPGCGLAVNASDAAVDPLFHPVPALATADPAIAEASVNGALGAGQGAVLAAYAPEFDKLDALLGCASGGCKRLSQEPPTVRVSAKTGLPGIEGAIGLGSTAVENMILAYADGKPADEIVPGVDAATILDLSKLHVLKTTFTTRLPYVARALGSNLLAHVRATLDRGGSAVDVARVPRDAKLVVFAGHDTNISALGGMLQLHWTFEGYQPDDTPPGGALVFEEYAPEGGAPFVRTFYEAQTLEQMRAPAKTPLARVRVYVPGCPSFDCPLDTFDRVLDAAIDPKFVGGW